MNSLYDKFKGFPDTEPKITQQRIKNKLNEGRQMKDLLGIGNKLTL